MKKAKTTAKKKKDIMERINTLTDVLKLCKPKAEEKKVIDYKGKNPRLIMLRSALLADMIADVYNEGKLPDEGWGYLPYYDSQRGFAFSGSGCAYWYSDSDVGSRFAFVNIAHSDDAGKKFRHVYLPLVTKRPTK